MYYKVAPDRAEQNSTELPTLASWRTPTVLLCAQETLEDKLSSLRNSRSFITQPTQNRFTLSIKHRMLILKLS